MVVVDTSVWIDHLRTNNARLASLLEQRRVLGHPFVTGELALGNLRQRDAILGDLMDLPQAIVAREDEVLAFISRNVLFGRGIGYVDAHLLASVRLTPGTTLWSYDKRLTEIAGLLELAMRFN